MAEYIALLSALRDIIPIMELLKEFANQGYNLISLAPKVYFKAFEENSRALEIACLLKMCPPTKAINVIYHYFCEHDRLGKISIFPIATNSQLTDVFIKPLTSNTFVHLQKQICDW